MTSLDRDTLFIGLTRPQMLLGAPYGYVICNAILMTELFLIFKSAWVLLASLAVHGLGWLASFRDPNFFGVWLVKVQRCPRVPNYALWRCNSYRP